MDKKSKVAILIGVVALIVVAAFFYFNSGKNASNFPDKNFPQQGNMSPPQEGNFNGSSQPRGNFSPQVNFSDETKKEITEFFEGSPSLEESKQYCSSSPMNCMYYCTEVDSENEICSELRLGER